MSRPKSGIRGDVMIFSDRAWMIIQPGNDKIMLRMLAGPDGEPRTTTVLRTLLAGRPVYRQVSALDDVDLEMAVDESTGELTLAELGDDPRKWTEAFLQRHGSRQTPDGTIMLGWFAAVGEAARSREAARHVKRAAAGRKKTKVAAKTRPATKSRSREVVLLAPPPRGKK